MSDNNTSSYQLKAIPEDVYTLILDEQHKIRKSRRISVYSIESTIYHMLREFDRCRKEEERKPKR